MKPDLTRRIIALRVLILIAALLGLNYIIWRWMFSVAWPAWYIAVPLVIAETYSLIDSLLFGLTMWRLRRRGEPPPPPPDATVDVFITTYNEPLELVLRTAEAAQRIRYPHTTWILDDGARPDLAAAAEARGIRYLVRASGWTNKPRHAKAGNLSNALMQTDGEFILILDADQVPKPEILDRTLGYFEDERMALVQTPQYFVNVPEGDPLGSQAPLFYGPIQEGKDGWNAAYFCGSNAVLRREALMQLGVTGYVKAVETDIRRALRAAAKVIDKARADLDGASPQSRAALDTVRSAVRTAQNDLRDGRAFAEVTYDFQQQVDAAAREVVDADVLSMRADLEAIAELSDLADDREAGAEFVLDETAHGLLTQREWSPLGAIESVRAIIRAVDVGREAEAQPMLPISTISVTEDMATCMRMHAQGWRSAFHNEILAHGLAPEDLKTMLTQRLRWAQGTVQVMLRENPLVQRGLSAAQRLMYWATMWSYLAGFAAVIYIAAPVLYLTFGIMPVQAWSVDFFIRLIPFLLVNQLMFFVVSRGTPTWRGQQYNLALFPVWIKACYTAFRNVYFNKPLDFAVTPKTRQDSQGRQWYLVRYQLLAMVILVLAALVGIVNLATGLISPLGFWVNIVWIVFDLAILSVVIQALRMNRQQEGAA
ncbi:glycosyltransferase family 2 protein [Hoyosella subflava]|uniref:Putative cellulose synthase catalytic subunit n=1 Tax=Hoyosella subflava (strain DSM 45089 / JCM 17490 / NBRC 109087 / DQS3-9A1) TaxID=443218 RepID=F6EET6_HOYSD|nr:glycosyltransferase family 2 protein [Hoyosella subflava]AEF40886.1 putative cellulose synthase catalytic subunit [Hoyosella subflava DQS3-9A1]